MFLSSFLYIILNKNNAFQEPNILDTEGNFFGLTQEITISDATVDLVEQLEKEVYARAEGDRRVRRYFDTYDTPFVGQGRRNYYSSYD